MILELQCLLTPPLLNMFDNKMLTRKIYKIFKNTYRTCIKRKLKEQLYDERLNNLAKYYVDRYSSDLHIFKDIYNCNLIQGFKHFQDIGVLRNYYLWSNTWIFSYFIC